MKRNGTKAVAVAGHYITAEQHKAAIQGLEILAAHVQEQIESLRGVGQKKEPGIEKRTTATRFSCGEADCTSESFKTRDLLNRHRRMVHGIYLIGPYKNSRRKKSTKSEAA